MITDEEPRQYDDNALGAQQLAFAVFEAAYGRPRGSGSEQPPKRPAVSVSPSLPFSGGIHSASTSTFDYLSGLASSVPVPKTVGDHGSRKVRAKVQEHMHERPVTEGMQEAFTGRAEALTRRPQDPRKVGDLLPWADYYFNAGGSKDL
jgi:hypothetical protein